MLLMHSNNREDIKEAYAGDIVALAGLKDTRTGRHPVRSRPKSPVILEKMDFPDPVIEIAIEPKSKADQEKLGVALQKLAAEDPTFRVSTDQESGQTILQGHGRAAPGHQGRHPASAPTRWKPISARRRWPIARPSGARPRSTTPTRSRPAVRASSRASRSCSSRSSRASGYSFESKVVGGYVPKEFIPGVEKGLESAKENGLLAGFPVIDFKATLIDGAYHDVDSQRAGLRDRRPRGLPRTSRAGRARSCSSRS